MCLNSFLFVLSILLNDHEVEHILNFHVFLSFWVIANGNELQSCVPGKKYVFLASWPSVLANERQITKKKGFNSC